MVSRAGIAAHLGDTDRAIDLLTRGLTEGGIRWSALTQARGYGDRATIEAPISPRLQFPERGGLVSGSMLAQKAKQFDDGLYAAFKLLTYLSQTGRSLSQELADVPKRYATPEIRVPCPDD